jgi:prepilin-type N-terminal cleavage/methylation domain-containing protein
MKKKGFTLVELLVVIAIIALLMSILMPALARVRTLAFRMVCGSNLSSVGKAMLIYANDYDDVLPRGGLPTCTFGNPIANWCALDRATAFTNKATITSCFYATVKYTDMTPKSFVCKGETNTSEFKLGEHSAALPTANYELVDAWDFGDQVSPTDSPRKHCSYSYHHCFTKYILTTTTGEPGLAVAADPNPWIRPWFGTAAQIFTNFNPIGTPEQVRAGNSIAHGQEMQNVLFLDGHVYQEKKSTCGVNDDNIYTSWPSENPTAPQKQLGVVPAISSQPMGRLDSFLVNDWMP